MQRFASNRESLASQRFAADYVFSVVASHGLLQYASVAASFDAGIRVAAAVSSGVGEQTLHVASPDAANQTSTVALPGVGKQASTVAPSDAGIQVSVAASSDAAKQILAAVSSAVGEQVLHVASTDAVHWAAVFAQPVCCSADFAVGQGTDILFYPEQLLQRKELRSEKLLK